MTIRTHPATPNTPVAGPEAVTIFLEFCDWCRICIPVAGEQARENFRAQHIHGGDGDEDE
jgi:hypothetical protein